MQNHTESTDNVSDYSVLPKFSFFVDRPSYPLTVFILVVNNLHTLIRQVRIIMVNHIRFVADDTAQPTGGINPDIVAADFFLHFADNVLGAADVTVYHAGTHAGIRILTQNAGRLDDFDFRKFCRLLPESLGADFQPWHDDVVQELALLVNIVKGGRSPEVDDDGIAAIDVVNRRRIHDFVRTHFFREIRLDADAGPDARAHDNWFFFNILTDGVGEGVHYLRHYAGDDYVLDFVHGHVTDSAKLHQVDAVFVAGTLRLGGYTEGPRDVAFFVNECHGDIRVSNVYCK